MPCTYFPIVDNSVPPLTMEEDHARPEKPDPNGPADSAARPGRDPPGQADRAAGRPEAPARRAQLRPHGPALDRKGRPASTGREAAESQALVAARRLRPRRLRLVPRGQADRVREGQGRHRGPVAREAGRPD